MVHFLLCFLFLASNAKGQGLAQQGDLFEMIFASANPTEAHESANRFASLVGDELKRRWPSRILDPDVELRVFMQNGTNLFRLTWTCRIVATSADKADYYFDRRGSMLSGATIEEAKARVDEEIDSSGKVVLLRKDFPNGDLPLSFVRDSYSGSQSEKYWYIKEYFLVAPR